MILNQEQVLVNALVEVTEPEKIILFGSYAFGKPNKNSDLDFCIIKNSILPARQRGKGVKIKLLQKNIHYHLMDIFHDTQKEIDKLKDDEYSFIYQIINTGRLVYELKL